MIAGSSERREKGQSVYLVTGGAGFIGSNIVSTLVERGERVRVLDNFSTGGRRNLAPLEGQIEVFEGDIRSYRTVREAVAGVEVVFHQAALPSVPRSIKDPITTDEVNVVGTLNVLEAARDSGVRRVVSASSSSIFGDGAELPKTEDLCPRPLSPYAISKLAAEQYALAYNRAYGLETVCLRYFNVFGPRQDPTSQYSAVIPRFVRAALSGEAPTIYGDGGQTRDFTFIANVVAANLLAAEVPAAAGQAFCIGAGTSYSLLDLIAILERITGRTIIPRFEPPRASEVRHSQAGIDKARSILGYEVSVPLEEGVGRTVDWFVNGGGAS